MGKNSRGSIDQRRKEIICYMAAHSNITIDELAERISASSVTIRRDINQLISEKMVARSGAGRFSLLHDPAFDDRYFRRYSAHHAEKVLIAHTAIDLVPEGKVIGIDSSSTCLEFGKLLTKKNDITVVTNNLFVPHYLMSHKSLHMHCIGGWVHLSSNSTEGPAACKEISGFNYDVVFFSASGLDYVSGLSNFEMEGIDTKLAFLHNAAKNILLIDSSKFGQKSSRNFLPLSEVDMIVTDDGITPENLTALNRTGIPYLLAKKF